MLLSKVEERLPAVIRGFASQPPLQLHLALPIAQPRRAGVSEQQGV